MNTMTKWLFSLCLLVFYSSCGPERKDFDATGSFEAIERIISAEATGVIRQLDISEGQTVQVGDTLGYIDHSQLALQVVQIESTINALQEKTQDAQPQIQVLEAQRATQVRQTEILQVEMAHLKKEVTRFRDLVTNQAAPQKQLDDLLNRQAVLAKRIENAETQTAVIDAQIESTRKTVSIQNRAILSEQTPNEKRLELVKKQIKDSYIVSDYAGTITAQLAYDGEFTQIGKPLYKIANLEEMILRAYVTADQLNLLQLNQEVTVRIDHGENDYQMLQGTITWISDQAEFTPKTIQTKNERVNKVYAIKVVAPNNGQLKMGMYGELIF